METGPPLYEIVSGQIRLGKREDFLRLHRESFTPLITNVGIVSELLLFIDIGRYHRFIDIYKYPNWTEYKQRTDRLLAEPAIKNYYSQIEQCIEGGITIELASSFPHFTGLKQPG